MENLPTCQLSQPFYPTNVVDNGSIYDSICRGNSEWLSSNKTANERTKDESCASLSVRVEAGEWSTHTPHPNLSPPVHHLLGLIPHRTPLCPLLYTPLKNQ